MTSHKSSPDSTFLWSPAPKNVPPPIISTSCPHFRLPAAEIEFYLIRLSTDWQPIGETAASEGTLSVPNAKKRATERAKWLIGVLFPQAFSQLIIRKPDDCAIILRRRRQNHSLVARMKSSSSAGRTAVNPFESIFCFKASSFVQGVKLKSPIGGGH